MRIAHITATFPPYWAGTGNVAYNQARVLHEMGHEVEVFTARPQQGDPLSFAFPVHYLPTLGRIGNAPFTPGLVRKLRGFDLLHLHYPYIFGAELTLLAARLSDIPLVVMYHNDLLSPGLKGALFDGYSRAVQPRVLSRAVTVIATTRDYAEHSLLAKARIRSLTVVPNAVDSSLLTATPHHNPMGNAIPYVLFVGAMDGAHFFKGVRVLIDAASHLTELPLHVVLVGEGDRREQYETYARSQNLHNVHFLGRVSLSDLQGLYSHALATVLPSTTLGEAFGLVLLESWAHHTPVIASNLPGVRSLVDENTDGLLAPPGDSRALAAIIARLLANPALARQMGRAGYDKVRRQYTWEHVGFLLHSIYERTLAVENQRPVSL